MADRSTKITISVALDETLSAFVAEQVCPGGLYEDFTEYVQDLIRRDMRRVEQQRCERLKAELALAFKAPESAYRSLTAAEIIAQHRS